ncbi:phosphohistidine phosphatase SixA [Calothrix sp. NIES-4071]|nr:phosphohistidine phosphatase SixA [Calothrix sp. NIES-4071]BAZ61760.1 phosphohistidine phosphatase SixA [Calothrix sp. NIES-4105]
MELYLFRHGIAEDKSDAIEDEKRKLTTYGRHKTEKIAKRLVELGLKFDALLTSPLVRAHQTAEILMEAGLSNKLEISSYLAPDGSLSGWIEDWLSKQNFETDCKLVLVGHEPDLSSWAELLVWGEAKGNIVLKKAGMIGVKLPENAALLGQSQMFWLTPPKYF